jgi:hypothetical protein
MSRHGGAESIYVLNGTLSLQIGNDEHMPSVEAFDLLRLEHSAQL